MNGFNGLHDKQMLSLALQGCPRVPFMPLKNLLAHQEDRGMCTSLHIGRGCT